MTLISLDLIETMIGSLGLVIHKIGGTSNNIKIEVNFAFLYIMYKRIASKFHKLQTLKKKKIATLLVEIIIPGFLQNWIASWAEEA